MDLTSRGEPQEASGLVSRIDIRRTRSGNRLWPEDMKGRIVRESLQPGARVCDVARRYGIKAQQLTAWRRLARHGRLALVVDEPADFVAIELNEPSARIRTAAKVEIAVGKIVMRLDGDTASTRIAEIVTALERGA